MDVGKKREPGIVILLCIVTLGVYWFVWMYTSFSEVARATGKPLAAGTWIPILAIVWVASLGVVAVTVVDEIQASFQPGAKPSNPFPSGLERWNNPLAIAGVFLGAAYYVLQLLYLMQAQAVVAGAVAGLPGVVVPSSTLLLLFSIFDATASIPFVGGLLSVASIVLSIIWIVQIQNAMNRYWESRPAFGAPSL